MSFRVLVVDDSKLARMAVAKALNALRPDWTRVEASNAEEALGHAKSGTFDMAIVDYNMPGRDGLELAAEILALKPGMPLAVISANHQVEVVTRAREVGATFLQKPLTEKALNEFASDAAKRLPKSP
ncbi:MAG: response regulator [Enhydrobacter sp.]|nr:response regulator [Enhydrobacter sp.]